MIGTEALWNQHLDRLAKHLLLPVTEELLRLRVDHDDPAAATDHHHRAGGGCDHLSKAFFALAKSLLDPWRLIILAQRDNGVSRSGQTAAWSERQAWHCRRYHSAPRPRNRRSRAFVDDASISDMRLLTIAREALVVS